MVRILWRVVTLWGILIKAYNFVCGRIEIAVSLLAVSLILNMDERISAWSPAATGSFADNIWIWFKSALVLFSIVVALKIIGMLEWINFTWNTKQIQRLKRQRFKNIENAVVASDRFAISYEWLYWSDEEDEGGNDPDIAYMNLSQPPEASFRHRCTRYICLCRRGRRKDAQRAYRDY